MKKSQKRKNLNLKKNQEEMKREEEKRQVGVTNLLSSSYYEND
jgi:hypothetical protein